MQRYQACYYHIGGVPFPYYRDFFATSRSRAEALARQEEKGIGRFVSIKAI